MLPPTCAWSVRNKVHCTHSFKIKSDIYVPLSFQGILAFIEGEELIDMAPTCLQPNNHPGLVDMTRVTGANERHRGRASLSEGTLILLSSILLLALSSYI